jgi:hypothetical protein
MKLYRPLARVLAFVGLAVATAVAPAPAFAGPAELALLQSYVGSWKGRGQLIGAETETVVCRLSINPGNSGKVNYSGRCAMAGTTLSVNGTLAYVEAARRFEAAMTSNVAFTGVAVGQRRGDGLVFNLRERQRDEEGREMTITAAIALDKSKILVDFNVVFNQTGDTIKASVPFTK